MQSALQKQIWSQESPLLAHCSQGARQPTKQRKRVIAGFGEGVLKPYHDGLGVKRGHGYRSHCKVDQGHLISNHDVQPDLGRSFQNPFSKSSLRLCVQGASLGWSDLGPPGGEDCFFSWWAKSLIVPESREQVAHWVHQKRRALTFQRWGWENFFLVSLSLVLSSSFFHPVDGTADFFCLDPCYFYFVTYYFYFLTQLCHNFCSYFHPQLMNDNWIALT